MITDFLASTMDQFSGRAVHRAETCEWNREFEMKWDQLYAAVSEYKMLQMFFEKEPSAE